MSNLVPKNNTQGEKVVLAYSGGLDTTCIVPWLKETFGSGMTEEVPLLRIGATIGVHAGPTSIGYGVIRRSDRLE
mgnify:CR=1 FL=1